jgi:cobalt/nickel transport system permease protein
VAVLVAALVVATPLGLLAEGTAWGEWGADEIAETGAGYVPAGFENGFEWEALMPDYSFGGLPDAMAYVLSAVAGVALLVIAFKLLSSFVGRRSTAAA